MSQKNTPATPGQIQERSLAKKIEKFSNFFLNSKFILEHLVFSYDLSVVQIYFLEVRYQLLWKVQTISELKNLLTKHMFVKNESLKRQN